MPTEIRPSAVWKQYRELVVTLLLVLLLSWLYGRRGDDSDWQAVKHWLNSNELGDYIQLLRLNGINSVYNLQEWLGHENFKSTTAFLTLPSKGQTNVLAAREDGVLQTWLAKHKLDNYYESFQEAGIKSLNSLAKIADNTLMAITSSDYMMRDVVKIKTSFVQKTSEEQAEIHGQMLALWALNAGREDAEFMSWRRMFIWTAIACLCVIVYFKWLHFVQLYGFVVGVIRRVPSYKNVLHKVTGRILHPKKCSVVWGWDGPKVVGNSFYFTICLFNRNGSPYLLQKQDHLRIEIRHQGADVPPSVEFLQNDEKTGITKVKVTLMVYKAGEYKMSILIRGHHISGSPYEKFFLPDDIVADKCALVNHTSIELGTEHVKQYMFVELRDQHHNTCEYSGTSGDFCCKLYEPDTGYSVNPDLTLLWDPVSRRVVIKYKVTQAGVYTATLYFQGVKLNNGEFTLVVLKDNDMSTVIKNATKPCQDTYFEAKLLKNDKHKKVYCYISPRQLTIKEFYMKIFPRRLYTFRVGPFVKFTFQSADAQSHYPILIISDNCQAPVTLASKDRNLIVATFANQLIKNIGGSETFKDKQDFFYSELRKLHLKRQHTRLSVKIHRNYLLESSYKALKDLSLSEWCKNFEIAFAGEAGLDWGGVRREFFEVLCVAMFDPSGSGMFTQFQEDTQGLVHPNPKRPPTLKLKYYEFAGKIVGKCLYESSLGGGYRQLVKAKFTRSFLAQLLGLRVHYKYFEQDDPELYTSKVRYVEEHSVDGLDMMFAEEEYQDGKLVKVIDLIQGGRSILVTDSTKLEYLDALAQHRLCSQVKDEIEAFIKGLNEMVPDNLLSIFDEYELELLLCGTGEYSVSDLKENHTLCGREPSFLTCVEWMWTILSGFTHQDMARFLQFVTGCSQLPSGGFKDLQPLIQISPAPTYGNLPTAHTCFNQLCLPEYGSLEEMHRALQTAISEGSQGFGLV